VTLPVTAPVPALPVLETFQSNVLLQMIPADTLWIEVVCGQQRGSKSMKVVLMCWLCLPNPNYTDLQQHLQVAPSIGLIQYHPLGRDNLSSKFVSTLGKQSIVLHYERKTMSQSIQPPMPSPLPDLVRANDSDRAHRKKKKKHFAAVGSGYVGKCDEIKEHFYNIGLTTSIDLFTKTT
jgi:hypothetical protein